MSDPIRVELTLDLDKYVNHGYRQVGEDDYVPQPATVETLIIEETARLMFKQARSSDRSDIYDDLRARVRAIRDELIKEQLAPVISEALAAGIQPTNMMGEAKGEPVTLRELILGEAKVAIKRLVEKKGDGFSRNPGRSEFQELVAAEVGAAFQKEVKAELDKAKAEVVAAVRAKGAELLAATVKDMAGRL